ncbi:hypothetical protein IscW_ISCW002245 [Ixodes scapularis]|uniref:Uncharacterized protein n=1 Tax=Ixodes scapularis TaxID=6945 RepID=B7PD22_IXOSC|nr:hypothetical protein IscW_ISCW002245 [Ixodes scapularis]|eukprot:XP_002410572.1 hypothetical protein IscW_ISCW002245 [Ixodes scapularis]
MRNKKLLLQVDKNRLFWLDAAPDRRRSSDEFCVVSSDGTSPAASSSTEDEKPSFLNVQLRHVERAPPLNVVFQTSGPRAEAPPASPSLTWKSHREVAEPRTLPPPRTGRTPLKRSASVQMRTGGTTSAAAGTHAPSPWPPVDGLSSAEDLPSWIREAERKRNCGIDWANLGSGSPDIVSPVANGAVRSPSRASSKQSMTNGDSGDVAKELGATTYDAPEPCAEFIDSLEESLPSVEHCFLDGDESSARFLELQRPDEDDDDDSDAILLSESRLATLLDEIFSEAEETCATPLPTLIKSPSSQFDRHVVDCADDRDDVTGADGFSSPEVAAYGTGESAEPYRITSPKQALMEELKHVLRKRNSMELLRDDILNEANVIDSATPLVRPGSPAEIAADSPRPVEPSEEEKEMQNTGLPTPPPMPPSDFWKKPSQERWSKPDAARRTRAIPVLTPTCHRDHGTQTATPDAVAPVLTQASVVHHMTPVTYTHQFVSSGPSPVLLLPHVDDTPLQPRPFYAMPVCQPVFARTAVTSVATPLYPNTTFVMSGGEELTRTPSEPKKIVTASKSTWTESGVTATPTPGMGDETKALLDEFGKCLEEDRAARAPSDLSRPRTATPVKSKITVETTTILQTVESSTRLIRGADQTSIKSICGNSEKGDILSNLSDSPIPFADDDDVMEELGFSSHCESRSASQNGIKRDIVTDEHLTVYTTTKKAAETPKDSTPQPSTSKQDEDVRSAFSPPPSRIQMTSPSASRSQIPVASRSPTPEKTFKANGDIHGELPRKSRPSGVTVLSASKGDSINSKFQRGPCPSPGQSSTVTTGPGGTVRGNHSRPFLHSATTDSAAGDLSNLDDVFRKTKSISVPNLLTTGREKSFVKKVVSQSTQTPNGLVTVDKCRVHGGRVAGAQTEDRLDSFLRDTLRKSTKEVEFVTKVDSSQPSKTLRKKVTTKILRGTSGKNGDVREVIEEFYDQSSLVLRPSNGIKNVTRSVRQASDGHKYLTTVITEAPAAGLSRRNRRRGFGDPDGHVIMV